MKNNKGFTMVELLTTIIIIGFVAGIGMALYSSVINSSTKRVYEAYEKTMRAETMQYIINNPEIAPRDGYPRRYYLNQLEIDPINNPKNKDDLCENSYVLVSREDTAEGVSDYKYLVCLICEDYNSPDPDCDTLSGINSGLER